MSTRPAVDKVMFAIMDEMLAVAYAVLDDDAVSVNVKTGTNTLADSKLREDVFTSMSTEAGKDPVLKALFAHYVVYLEWTRPPEYGKRPPISALKGWAEKRGIDTDANTLYAISYAIWRDGHQGRPIFATMDTLLEGKFTERWADQLRDAILTNLDKYFNDGN